MQVGEGVNFLGLVAAEEMKGENEDGRFRGKKYRCDCRHPWISLTYTNPVRKLCLEARACHCD